MTKKNTNVDNMKVETIPEGVTSMTKLYKGMEKAKAQAAKAQEKADKARERAEAMMKKQAEKAAKDVEVLRAKIAKQEKQIQANIDKLEAAENLLAEVEALKAETDAEEIVAEEVA